MAWDFPEPSGPYPVACTDVLAGTGQHSSLFRMYYPTKVFKPDHILSPLWLSSPEYGKGWANIMKVGRLSKLVQWFFGNRRIPVLWNGPLVMPQSVQKLPVVLLSHGLAMNRTCYNYIAYEIASNGFLVASVEHREGSACTTFYMEEEGDDTCREAKKIWLPYQHVTVAATEEKEIRRKQVHKRASEISKLMDSVEAMNAGALINLLQGSNLALFKEQIDVNACAVAGHSFGGATAIVSMAKDPRLKVGVAMDVWMFPIDNSIYKCKIDKPILFINSDSFQWASNIARIRKLDKDVTGIQAERKLTTLLGTVHATQSDLTFLIKSA